MKKIKKYETLYRRDNDTGRVIIDIALDDHLKFFHEWDNSVFKKPDMHPELAQFLDLCSEDIPMREELEIVISIDQTIISPEKENLICISYQNYYNSIKRLENRKSKKFIRDSAIILFISIVLLSAYALLIDLKEYSIFSKVLLESLLIGGWVFAWEAVHMLFIDIIEPFHKRREINRFLETKLSFKYKN